MFRKIFFTMALALIVLPAAASAQLASGNVTVTATVDPYAAITGTGDMQFGSLSRTVNNVVNPAAGVGAALRTVTFNSNIDVTFSGVASALSGPNGASLPVLLNCAYEVGGTWSAGTACSTATFAINNTLAGLATAQVGIGGRILATDVQTVAAGDYQGQITIVVTAR